MADRTRALQVLAWKYATLEGPRNCGRSPRFAAHEVGVTLRMVNGKPRAKGVGVQHCGSQWACPACMVEIAAGEAAELSAVIKHVLDHGGSVLHLILTVSHGRTDELRTVWDALQAGWERITGRTWWADLRRYGVEAAVAAQALRDNRAMRQDARREAVATLLAEAEEADPAERVMLWAFVRAAEATWGTVNAWHPHLHCLLMFRSKITEEQAEGLRRLILAAYRSGLAKHGFGCDDEHGVRVEIATDRRQAAELLGRYLNKIAQEIARPDTKKIRTGVEAPEAPGEDASAEDWARWMREAAGARRYTPLEILERLDDPEVGARMRALWEQWEWGTKGRQRITHGGDWAALVEDPNVQAWVKYYAPKEAPVSTEGLGADAPEAPADTIVWSVHEDHKVRDCRHEVYRSFEAAGWRGGIDFLRARGVRWRWRYAEEDVAALHLMHISHGPCQRCNRDDRLVNGYCRECRHLPCRRCGRHGSRLIAELCVSCAYPDPTERPEYRE